MTQGESKAMALMAQKVDQMQAGQSEILNLLKEQGEAIHRIETEQSAQGARLDQQDKTLTRHEGALDHLRGRDWFAGVVAAAIGAVVGWLRP